ncbi:hypothetical protein DCAR_0728839 [Daucus carota subsp. sativus]|uniref:Uncharacterized protein n=1 Tax=Daucus carota subsp. sativus TaxID=79200 RepID=A0A161Y6R1_DAUCS|nr:PREDICTED: uncharacterized protein LOC108196880 [Daucus carota subsp. sativus]WOH09382.1 hypothetical protein DCAR_0728839 [Daucus carota subsp. sativus]
MYPSKLEDDDLFNLDPNQAHPSILDPFSLPPISPIPLFPDADSDADSSDGVLAGNSRSLHFINPDPHISTQFYTFNQQSHALMINCILSSRVANPEEIRVATPASVLSSWRSVWKDRNEDTAYVTAWKRIQDKLNVHVDDKNGNSFLCFKNNCNQFVSYTDQWQDIVMSSHSGSDFKHVGLRETIERIKQVWTVGAKFYGIPESFIRVCVTECPVCCESAPRNKRRRFEYTESFEVPANEVASKLHELAAKHKVVLCIRQKYIRCKPFMAEVKDYACHRAGEPASTSKKSKIMKREPYASKRCGCGFRIRAIVPISKYNEKDKTFVYEEEGVAVFKLYAVHSGHEPGPLDGNARIMHRVVGNKGGFMDHDVVYGMSEEVDNENFSVRGKDDGDMQLFFLQQAKELKTEIGLLEGKIGDIPSEVLGSLSQALFETVNKFRSLREHGANIVSFLSDKRQSDDLLVGESDLADWGSHHQQIYGNGKNTELIDDDEDSFERTLGDVSTWDQIRTECRVERDLLGETCKHEKWLKCSDFDEKSILDCEESKVIKPMRDGVTIESDGGLTGLQVDSFYVPENPKWFDSTCGLEDSTGDCGNSEFRPGETV